MFKWFKKSNLVKKDLFSFKNEPLTKLSILLLIILDIFVLSNVMVGINNQIEHSPKSYKYYPFSCVQHFKEIKTDYHNFIYNHFYKNSNPLCIELQNKIFLITSNKNFDINHNKLKDLQKKLQLNNQRLNQISARYNTRLFEKIANIPNNKALEAKKEYKTILKDNKQIQKSIDSITLVSTLAEYKNYENFINQNKTIFFKEKKEYELWQPFLEYKNVLIFILPLLLISSFFYYLSKKKQLKGEKYNPIVKIISAHISVILILPLVWYTLILIYEIIPKTLLKNIINFLIDIGLVSLLNYLSIFIVVLLLGGLIYFVQKKVARLKENKNYKKLISTSRCFSCETHIDYSKNFCPYCGIKLHQTCKSCNKEKIKHQEFCSNCGDNFKNI